MITRPLTPLVALGLALAIQASHASAQQGSLDQVPTAGSSSSFAVNGSWFQQQVRAGRAGLLEGFEVIVSGAPVGSVLIARLRLGPGWNSSPAVFTGTRTVDLAGPSEVVYFDTSAAGVQLAVDDLFVIEVEGHAAGGGTFNYSVNKFNLPIYPEPFFLNGSAFPGGGTFWNLSFRTWMDGGVGARYCSTAPNSDSLEGALMSIHGSTSVAAADLVLRCSRTTNTPGIFYFGPSQAQVPFGDGFRCVAPPTVRLPVLVSQGNLLTYAIDYSLPETMVLAPGSTWNFQTWYRDPDAMASGFNLSDAVELTFLP